MMKSTKTKFTHAFILLVLLAFMLRFFDLGYKMYNWDEAVTAWITRSLVETNDYSYSPVYHGPLQYYLTSLAFSLFGYSEFAGRILPALAGVLLIALLYPLRNFIGEKATLAAAFLFTISPTFLYYSRFFREDIYISLFTLAIFVCGLLYIKTKESKYVSLAALALGLSLSAKENTLITGFIFVSFFAFYFLYGLYKKFWKFSDLLDAARKYNSHTMLFIAVTFIVVFAVYTNFFENIEAFGNSIVSGAEYWLGQHQGGKFAAPFYFYLGRMWLYELPILIFGSAAIVHYYKKKSTLLSFLSYWALLSFVIYSYLQEKMPQLLTNILLPMGILASMYLAEKISSRNIKYVFAVAVILTLVSGIRAVYINPTDSREPIMYAQTEQQIRDFVKLLGEKASDYGGFDAKLQILHPAGEGLSSPVYWYLWDYKNKEYVADNLSKATEPIVISLIWNNETVNEAMKGKGYDEKRFYTWGYVNHDANFWNYLNPRFYFFRQTRDNVSEQGILYLYTK